MTWTQRLQHDLESEGSRVETSERTPGLVISAYEGWEDSPIVDLAMSEAEIEAYIYGMREDGPAVFPDVSPEEGAYRLFTVHLEEIIMTWKYPRLRIAVRDDDLEAELPYPLSPNEASEGTAQLSPEAGFQWVSEPPDR